MACSAWSLSRHASEAASRPVAAAAAQLPAATACSAATISSCSATALQHFPHPGLSQGLGTSLALPEACFKPPEPFFHGTFSRACLNFKPPELFFHGTFNWACDAS